MLRITALTTDEFESALDLIEDNMTPVLSCHGILCDRSWNRENFGCKDNYSIFARGKWIGFISLETSTRRLFVHTLQLVPVARGNIYGRLVFQWLDKLARATSAHTLACKAIRGSAAADLYCKLGFLITAEDGALIELELNLDHSKLAAGHTV